VRALSVGSKRTLLENNGDTVCEQCSEPCKHTGWCPWHPAGQACPTGGGIRAARASPTLASCLAGTHRGVRKVHLKSGVCRSGEEKKGSIQRAARAPVHWLGMGEEGQPVGPSPGRHTLTHTLRHGSFGEKLHSPTVTG
jgi:hypothetical protein